MTNEYADLPDSVRDLAEVVGLKTALKIVEARGGARLYVPKRPHRAHWLSEVIGWDKLRDLSSIYGGEEIEVPTCATRSQRTLAREIATASAQGASVAELARRYRYSESGIRKLLHRVKAESNKEKS